VPDSTACGSRSSGGYAFDGKTTDHMMWRSQIITKEVEDMAARNGMRPVHPGEILREEIDMLGLSANALAKALDVPTNRITAILHGQRGVTADTALRLAHYFGTTPQVWLNLQKIYELRRTEVDVGQRIAERVKPRSAAA